MTLEILDENDFEQQLKEDQIVESDDDYDQKRRAIRNSKRRGSKAIVNARKSVKKAQTRVRQAQARLRKISRRLR